MTLSAPSAQNVTVAYATQNNTAFAGGSLTSGGKDYGPKSGTLTFTPGQTSKTIDVTINGDVANEADETFFVVLSNPSTTAQIQNGTGTGTILNDDALPTPDRRRITRRGSSGKSNMAFTVTLSALSGRTVNVSYATADDTAVTTGLIVAGGTDYTAQTGTLTFAPGQTTKTILIPITGDTTFEPDETFTVTLAAPVNSTLTDNTAVGTIVNDDAAPALTSQRRHARGRHPSPQHRGHDAVRVHREVLEHERPTR
ncbi:MAG: Calx-beta domain-containing protein [Polyangiaceae bacterium]